MQVYSDLIRDIIEEVSSVMGPAAKSIANSIDGIKVNGGILLKGNPEKLLKQLLVKYKSVLGPVAVTISKKGARKVLEMNPKLDVPAELR